MNLIKRLFQRRRLDDDLSGEIQQHLQERTDELMERGLSRKDAASQARREFGNVALIEEDGRDVWRWIFIESVIADLRYGLRQLGANPGFTAVAVLTLGLGIGANAALFSVVNGVLLSPLAYPDADSLVTIHESKPNFRSGSISYPNFLDWQNDNQVFSEMAIFRRVGMNLTGQGDGENINVEFITSDLLKVLGLKPLIGRDLVQGEDRVGGPPIVLIGAGMWNSKFQSSPDVLEK
ncbi:MAG TPA: permease prefix domain 1-containing protein, partial [Blastocatellia bacterium]|nr:permease prefix domain 1-containing protein [Blastocatellia bacterium]